MSDIPNAGKPMSATDLIERMEEETGQRVDANDWDNAAVAGIFGALARVLGQSRHEERDDVAAGLLIRHRMTPEYQAEQEGRKMVAEMLAGGVSPESIRDLLG